MSLRRPLVALFVAVSALGLGVPAYAGGARTASQGPATAEGQFVQELLVEINAVRAAHSLRPLRIGPALRRAADQHDREMGRLGYFEHDSPSGVSFSGRLERYYPSGRRYWSVGENLLWAGWSLTPKAAVRIWMRSPPHRANLLESRVAADRDCGTSTSVRTGLLRPPPRLASDDRLRRSLLATLRLGRGLPNFRQSLDAKLIKGVRVVLVLRPTQFKDGEHDPEKHLRKRSCPSR